LPAHVPPGSQQYHGTTPQSAGDVRIFNATKLEAENTIRAHQSAICCLALNNEGTLLATASEKGTIIRVFRIKDGEKLFEFRRGSLPAYIYHMSFNATSSLLCVSSATETVHIFKLAKPSKPSSPSAPASPTSPFPPSHARRLSTASRERSESPSSEEVPDTTAIEESKPQLERKPSGFIEGISSRIRQASRDITMGVGARMGDYLPSSLTQALEPQRDFAHVKIPRVTPQNSTGPLRSIVAMSANRPQLIVVTSEGAVGVYNIDMEKGGEGILEHEYT
jgi:autophagy-related protein 18